MTNGQLKCLYSNTHSTGNKQEELETLAQLDKYDLFGHFVPKDTVRDSIESSSEIHEDYTNWLPLVS